MDTKQIQLISPKDFKEEFAPTMGLSAIRALFSKEDFPATKVGDRFYTTREASIKWLASMGKNIPPG